MKKCLVLIVAALLLAFTASAQWTRGGQKKEAPKTEKTQKKRSSKESKKTVKSSKSDKSVAEEKRKQEEAERQRVAEEQRRLQEEAEKQRIAAEELRLQQEEVARQRAVLEEQQRQQEEIERQRIIQQAVDDMVWVEGGTFKMNYREGVDVHKVKVTLSGFYISKYEVTQELWQAVMGNNPSHFTGNPRLPVEMVSWNDCQEFLRKLNQMTGKNFRLPTEAEWEYAARGGKKSRGYDFSGSNNPKDVAWDRFNSGESTQPVGMKLSNELGLYDMSGNVWEWCQDWYGEYSNSPSTNPVGPSMGSGRVIRGGSCNENFLSLYVDFRTWAEPTSLMSTVGLRLAL